MLAKFDITYVTQKTMKRQAIADHLAENSVEGYQPMTNLFPDESIPNIEPEEKNFNWCMHYDGAVNIHGNKIRAILISPASVLSSGN